MPDLMHAHIFQKANRVHIGKHDQPPSVYLIVVKMCIEAMHMLHRERHVYLACTIMFDTISLL
jgi:hypothetical protein